MKGGRVSLISWTASMARALTCRPVDGRTRSLRRRTGTVWVRNHLDGRHTRKHGEVIRHALDHVDIRVEEREILLEAEPDTFFVTPHYKGHPMVMVRPERLDLKWAKANLIRVWRAQAPKRVLKAYDEQA